MLRASAGSISFVSIYGATGDIPQSDAAFAFFLEIDGVRILLDCGWNDRFDVWYLEQLLPYAKIADVVLLSTPELKSCGALPFVMEHMKPSTHVFAAPSTAKMGIHGVLHPFLYQFPNTKTFTLGALKNVFTLTVDKIYSAFRNTREPFGRKVMVKNGRVEVECSTVFTGRLLGGHGWIIKHQIDEIFYCPDFSVKPSYALKRFTVPRGANIVLVEGFPLSSAPSSASRREDEQFEQLFKEMQHTLRSGSDVLIPVNVAGRGLEVLGVVARILRDKGGDLYKVVFASVQAQELIDKAATITELLRDDIVASEDNLFANVIACRTAEDVLAIGGSKVIVADGETLDFGIAADLLQHILPSNVNAGGEHLIVFPQPPYHGTNAYTIAETQQMERLQLSTVRRTRLSREELAEYYMELDRELEERRRAMHEEGAFRVDAEGEGGDLNAGEDDDEDDDEKASASGGTKKNAGAAGRAAGDTEQQTTAARVPQTTPGLVLPPYLQYTSTFLQFPTLETSNTLNSALMKNIDVAYGLPVSDSEQLVIQQRAPARNHSDEGPEALQIRNDAQHEANVPSKILTITHDLKRCCRAFHTDFSGHPDASTLKHVLRLRFELAKKIVCIRGTVDDWRAMSSFTRIEKKMRCGDNVLIPPASCVSLELATPVLSYVVRLDPELERANPKALRRVREPSSKGFWEVGWVNGGLRRTFTVAGSERRADAESELQRQRVEGGGDVLLTLAPLTPDLLQASAEERARRGLQRGSFFVGEIDLVRLKDGTNREVGLTSEFHRKAPMLVFDEGVCVRKGEDGTVTVASIATPAMFDVRRGVYKQFAQTL